MESILDLAFLLASQRNVLDPREMNPNLQPSLSCLVFENICKGLSKGTELCSAPMQTDGARDQWSLRALPSSPNACLWRRTNGQSDTINDGTLILRPQLEI
jgi:hypothetical protein